MQQRIFITGTGTVCPLGIGVEAFWHALLESRSGIAPLTKIPTAGLRNPRGGEVSDFDWNQFGEEGDCDEASQFAFSAALEATAQAGLSLEELQRIGIVFGTNFGGAASWEATCDMARDGFSDPETFRQFLPDHAAFYTASRWKNEAPRATLSNACSSGAHAIGLAADWLKLGKCDIALAGGFDGLGISTLAGLSILRTISPDELRPFDKNRSGTLFGEGGAMLVLETQTSMEKRGAIPLAEFLGWSVNSNAYHLTAPDKDGAGLAAVMRRALENARLDSQKIRYVNAHGTGTQFNDLAETQAIHTVFGSHAMELAVSSIKAATSHTMGAAGALEAIATILALKNGVLPPTLNLETPDPNCDLDYVPNTAREAKIEFALSNSSGIGGNNASLVLGRV
ncbi:3-oxoacyl-[acyl-carrier-protein] synthase II/nodulation protein E [Abditibacterium utsteinense]|uniref:3-oxoacyl-[acyl-carrier-protein] synthase II/nodulation protein E n=1 Tax=Abditibacterium utsteinense TaxID=1960156 RepID=A0A2S8SQB3_9BACT|nr:beta-ketoacyl-[acyl-carrier-protein] synthase family protein [Abditibacterium utsteinense]PQV62976.1 3-oxoacyl-[acyl-carrier-protein] synthase II/nodulation protein E [Abditibacterium utsteinense]